MKTVVVAIVLSMGLVAAAVPSGPGAAGQAQTQPAPVGVGTIEGTVTQAGSNMALADVKISVAFPAQKARALIDAAGRGDTGIPAELLVAAAGSGAARGPAGPLPLSATTDAAGHFSLAAPDGPVVVRAQKDGFFGPAVNGVSAPIMTTQALVMAKTTTTVRLTLVAGGAVTGRVTDTNGKPMANLAVVAVRREYRRGVPALEFSDGRETDDRGAYRVFGLAPGEYYLVALTNRSTAPPASSTRDAAVPTFYPSAVDLATAVPVTIKGGDDQPGMDIQVRIVPTFTLSGRVTSTLPAGSEISALNNSVRPTIPQISLIARDPGVPPVLQDVTGGAVAANADGTFVIRDVQPGRYDLLARLPASTGWGPQNAPGRATSPWAFGRAIVDVQSSDVDGVSVVVHQGVDVPGRVTVDGSPMAAAVQLSLDPDDNSSTFLPIFQTVSGFQPAIDQGGAFVFPLIPEGHYRLRVGFGAPVAGRGALPMPPTTALAGSAYVADVQQRGVSVYDGGFDIGAGAADPLEVMVRTDGGVVDGTVLGPDRKPAPGMTVVVVPDASRRRNPGLYVGGSSDANGHFTLMRVAPGSYKVFAWDSVPAGAPQNPEFVQRFEASGAVVTVRPGAMATVQVAAVSSRR